MDLGVMALIGIILLIGIVKKNAIMMIDFALEAERKEGKKPVDAIYEACLLRFRPIMMTTFAALFGAVPLALGSGTGSELRRPLGVTIIGGLMVSQLLTLLHHAGCVSVVRPAGEALRHLRAPKPAEAVGDWGNWTAPRYRGSARRDIVRSVLAEDDQSCTRSAQRLKWCDPSLACEAEKLSPALQRWVG